MDIHEESTKILLIQDIYEIMNQRMMTDIRYTGNPKQSYSLYATSGHLVWISYCLGSRVFSLVCWPAGHCVCLCVCLYPATCGLLVLACSWVPAGDCVPISLCPEWFKYALSACDFSRPLQPHSSPDRLLFRALEPAHCHPWISKDIFCASFVLCAVQGWFCSYM